ncbi:MAG TPA: PIG-L family deacetylase [Streptomyces sp.]
MSSTRRRFLHYASLGAATLTVGGCGLHSGHGSSPSQGLGHGAEAGTGPEPGDPVSVGRQSAVVQVVAHADDDLYFINPETLHFVRAGIPLTSVYLTAGESLGLGPKTPAVRRHEVPVLNRSQYAASRFSGLRRAYAQMITGDHDSPWSRTTKELRSGTVAEVDTLLAAPHIRLVMLNMLESGDLRREYRGRTMRGLVEGTAKSVPTLVLTDSPVTNQYAYTRDKVLAALDQLLTEARPSLVCTLDHDSEHKPGRHGKGVAPTDHFDHTAAAQFTLTAVERYRPAAGAPTPVLQSYRGYANELYPLNLDTATMRRKTAYLSTYSGRGLPCAVRIGCGDHNVDNLRPSLRRFSTTQHRYQGDTSWLRPLPDGRLTAFAVISGQVMQWTQKAVGAAAWNAPVALPGGGLLGQVAAVTLPDKRIQLFAVQHGGMLVAPKAQRRAIVTCVQSAPGGRFGTWRTLGGPDGTVGAKAREIGLPYAAVDTKGRVHVVARTYKRELAARTMSAAGIWGPWKVLPGPVDVQDGVCLLPRSDGRVEIYGGTRKKFYRWTITDSAHPAPAVALPLPVPSCAPTAVELPGGRVRVFLRPAASQDVHVHEQRTGSAVWTSAGILHSEGGYGPIAVAPVQHAGSVAAATQLTVGRNDSGTVSARLWPGNGAAGSKVSGDSHLLVGTPSIATGGDGHVYFSGLGVDGQLNVVRLDDWETPA